MDHLSTIELEDDESGESNSLLSKSRKREYDGDLEQNRSKTYTLQKAVNHLGFGRFQVKLMLILGFLNTADGMEVLIIAVLGPVLQCDWSLSDLEVALITTAVFFGMVLISPFSGKVIDHFGRKRGIFLAVIWCAYFSILSSFSPTYPWMLILRLLVGASLSSMLHIIGYTAELLPTEYRRYVIFLYIFWPVGGLLANGLGLITIKYLNWRYYVAISAVPITISIILISWIPESPRFLMMVGKEKEALQILERISRDNKKPLPTGKLHVSAKITNRGRIMDLFDKELRVTTLCMIYLWFTIGFAYYGVVLITAKLYHSPKGSCSVNPNLINTTLVCHKCSPLTNNDYLDMLWTTLAEFPGIFWSLLMADKLGRKKIMGSDFFIASAFFLLLLLCTKREITMTFIFITRATIFGAIVTLETYTPEVYPTHLRGIAIGFSNTWCRLGGMVTPFLAQVLLDESLHLTVILYSVFLILASIVAMLLPIETKLRPLDTEIEKTY